MFKFVATGDTHFGLNLWGTDDPVTGVNTRALDAWQAFDQIIDYSIKNKISLITHSGDVYNHKSVSQVVVNEFFKRTKRISDAGIDFVILSGNHDKSRLSQAKCSLDLLSTLETPNVYRTDGSELIDLNYVQVATLGYYLSNEEIKEELERFNKQIDWSRPAILIGHLQVETPQFANASFKEDLNLTPLSLLTEYPYQFISLGHLHKPVTLCEKPKTMYNGSLVRCSFSEEKDRKGFNVITLDGPNLIDVHRQSVDCLQMLTLRGTMAQVRESLDGVDQAIFANTIVRCIIEEDDELVDEKYLKDKLCYAFKAVISKEAKKTQQIRMERGANMTSMNDALRVYFKDDEEADALMLLVKELREQDSQKVLER